MIYAVRTEPRDGHRTCNSRPMASPLAAALEASFRTGRSSAECGDVIGDMCGGEEVTILPPPRLEAPGTYEPATVVAYEPKT